MSAPNKNKKQQQQQQSQGNKPTQQKKKANNKKNEKSVKKSSSACPWILGSFGLIFAIIGAVAYDVSASGGTLAGSASGKMMAQMGVLPHVECAVTSTLKYSARGYKWSEANFPIYYQTTCTTLGPYIDLSKDVSIILYNNACKQYGNLKNLTLLYAPVVADFIDQYIPGLSEKISNFAGTACSTICTATSDAYASIVNILQTKVFVGQLSPENLGKALNSTQNAAAEYYSWFYDKVDFYAKIK